jgi:hypothetical protein
MATSPLQETTYIALKDIKHGVPKEVQHTGTRVHIGQPNKVDFFPDLLALQKK